jgi:3-phenylpropionate/cinnamic acid dioxygenase small subunit
MQVQTSERPGMKMGSETGHYSTIVQLLARCARLIDDGQYEEMLELFAESAKYEVLPLENQKQGLPSSLMRCSSRGMLGDRIMGLRKASVINIHTDRHILSFPEIVEERGAGEYRVKTSFACYQTSQEGRSALFAVGYYDDNVKVDADGARFMSRVVVLETFSVPSLMGVPL